MKAALHETNLDCYKKIYHDTKWIELTGESVVSDKMPDIGLLGDTSSHVILRGKRTEDGLAVLEGDIQTTVCYLPDGAGGCCSIEIGIPWQAEFTNEQITDRGTAVGDVRVAQVETRMLNPRKVLVKVQLCVEVNVYEKKTMILYDDLESDGTLQIRKSTTQCNVIGTVCEKTFVATDEYPLPAHLQKGTVLCKSVRMRVDDVKTLANKLIIKGSVLSDVVLASEQGTMERVSFTSSISFIAETDCEEVSADMKAVMLPTALYYEVTSNGQLLSVEVHGVCQMVTYSKKTLEYISDVYSNFFECRTESEEQVAYMESKNTLQRDTVNVSLNGRSSISEILFTTVQMYLPRCTEQSMHVPLGISACVRYENGTMDWLKKQITAEFKRKDAEQILTVRAVDIYNVANGEEAVIRISLEAEVCEERECRLDMITSVETDEEHPFCTVRPSLTVVRRGGCLWKLAREFGSTVELIQRYNRIDEEELASETLLLIPIQRQ